MATTKPRCTITFEDETLRDRVDSFRFDNRYRSQNDAIMALINKGIEVLTGDAPKPRDDLSAEEKRVLKAYRSASDEAKYFALQLLERNTAEKKASQA